jgi:hypothetical protein
MKEKSLSVKIILITAILLLISAVLAASESQEEKRERLIKEKIRSNTADSFVVIHYYFKKSTKPQPSNEDRYSYFNYEPSGGQYIEKIIARQSYDIAGVIISDDGKVFTADNYIKPEIIDKITVTGPDGKVLNAVADKVLVKSSGQVIRITDPLPSGFKPLKFAVLSEPPDRKTDLYGICLLMGHSGYDSYSQQRNFMSYYGDEKQSYYIVKADKVYTKGKTPVTPDCYYFGISDTTVVCDTKGNALGLITRGKVLTETGSTVWKGVDILADSGMNQVDGEKQIQKQFEKFLYQVKITFRPPPKEDDEFDSGISFSRYLIGGGESHKEMDVYGLAVSPKTLLMPFGMEQDIVEGIDSISIKAGDSYLPAKFSGVLKDCDVTVITIIDDGKLENVLKISPDVELVRGQPFWTVLVRELAGRDLVIDYNRWIDKRQGYESRLYPVMENPAANGSWLLDRNGRFAGIYTAQRHPFKRILPYLTGHNEYSDTARIRFGRIVNSFLSGYYASDDENVHIYSSAFLASVVSNLQANLDSHIRHKTKDEQKRRVWLGVEFTAIDKETAKQMNLRKYTEDGRIGLLVNRVYAGSPAEKIGLVEGDVLLRIQVSDAPLPIELKYSREYDYRGIDVDETDVPQEIEGAGYQMPRSCPWPGRDNYLTRMLKTIGEGAKVSLLFVHDGNEVSKDFVIEQSPRDSLSANKYKDETIGITVKDLTYEVRSALRLSPDDKAIVVSKVEPGTAAALARINPYELIRAIEGQEVASVEQFASAIKKAQSENKKSVRITIEWLGKTRLADLKFEAKESDANSVSADVNDTNR